MNRHDVAEVLAKPISQELLGSSIPARLAYVGIDGAPRAIPIGFWWTGEHVVMATVPKSAKVRALRQNPRVALTIDTQDQWPPRVLMIRGAAGVELVDGVPDAYVEASRKVVPAEHFDGWEQGVRGMYEQMVRITVEPDWAKLLDFETTLPKAVEDLLPAQAAGVTAGGPGVRRES
ncbi:pyridoxamine 5'-phosphate oxidase family protein [Nonomuraea jiangxiensis]|uniref:Pyridoxamine 5'-phosphate oxidase n=1 Tax=Nonomuraea jiangxiensis TaxID=633440 RepID=A0A1G9IW31_9ACTN|nr:pyridoxamine 5'-phosphate oxidase family protein [Nonomuraea jiangxiensis]SDL29321.1 Pyridoxamine 5'-phosphate oxidase [Nonomuraea jiangxiensis]